MSLEKYGPLVRRRLRFFLSAEDAPDERLLAFFQASVIPAETTCDDVWALATRFALADVRAGRRRNLLVAPTATCLASTSTRSSATIWNVRSARRWRTTPATASAVAAGWTRLATSTELPSPPSRRRRPSLGRHRRKHAPQRPRPSLPFRPPPLRSRPRPPSRRSRRRVHRGRRQRAPPGPPRHRQRRASRRSISTWRTRANSGCGMPRSPRPRIAGAIALLAVAASGGSDEGTAEVPAAPVEIPAERFTRARRQAEAPPRQRHCADRGSAGLRGHAAPGLPAPAPLDKCGRYGHPTLSNEGRGGGDGRGGNQLAPGHPHPKWKSRNRPLHRAGVRKGDERVRRIHVGDGGARERQGAPDVPGLSPVRGATAQAALSA